MSTSNDKPKVAITSRAPTDTERILIGGLVVAQQNGEEAFREYVNALTNATIFAMALYTKETSDLIIDNLKAAVDDERECQIQQEAQASIATTNPMFIIPTDGTIN